jgi:hypothetical protein
VGGAALKSIRRVQRLNLIVLVFAVGVGADLASYSLRSLRSKSACLGWWVGSQVNPPGTAS